MKIPTRFSRVIRLFVAIAMLAVAVPAALGVTKTWSGATSDNWSLNTNWLGNVAPVDGDDLVFPQGASRKSTTFNNIVGASFSSITIDGTGYTISGNGIFLTSGTNGIVFGSNAGPTTLSVGINVATAHGWMITQPLAMSGSITLAAQLTVDTTANVAFTGVIDGASSLRKAGTGTLTLSGNNFYGGQTAIVEGTVVVQHNNALGLSGSVASRTTVNDGAVLALDGVSLNIAETLSLNGQGTGGGAVRMLSGSCNAPACTLSGPITLLGPTRIEAANALLNLNLTGPIAESGGARMLTLRQGSFTIANTASHTGGTRVEVGGLSVSGTIGDVQLAQSGVQGTGTVGGITIEGSANIAPGASVGTLNANGNVDFTTGFASTVQLKIEAGGATPGTYDLLNVTGSVNLAGSTLALSTVGGFVPTAAHQFTVVQSTGPITGQFAQGTSVTFNGVNYAIVYNTNSVVLKAGRTWSGFGANNIWTNGLNWVGNVGPQGSEVLEFPVSANRKDTMDNNTPVNNIFDSFLFTGRGYVLSGLPVQLITGITENSTGMGAANQIALDLRASGAAMTFVANGGPLTVAKVNLTSASNTPTTLTVDGTQSTTLGGQASGTGGIVKTGPGTLTLGASNTYQGATQINSGILTIMNTNSLGATAIGTAVSSGATLQFGGPSIHPAEPLTLSGAGVGNTGALNAASCGTAGCSWQNSITLAGDATISAAASKLTLPAIGQTGGARALTFSGAAGRIILAGNNTYAGGTTIDAGTTLQVDGSIVGNTGFGGAGATLAGIGTVVTIVGTPGVAHTIAPGASVGTLHAGTVTMTPSSTLQIEIGGAGSNDVLSASNTVAIGGATLQGILLGGFTPAPGAQFTIIQATNGVTGQFAPASSVTIGGIPFAITYNANSVVLTAPMNLSTVTVTKAGAGTGTVTSNGAINCGATCAANVANGSALTLQANPDAGQVFTGWLGPCTGTGTCSFTVNAATTVSATFAPSTIGTRILDVDLNSQYDALTDGIMIIRALFGLTGTLVTGNALGPSPMRSDPNVITTYINDVKPLLDVDGNGIADALTDGIIIIRFLFNIVGDPMISNALGQNPTRTTSAAIATYLGTLKP